MRKVLDNILLILLMGLFIPIPSLATEPMLQALQNDKANFEKIRDFKATQVVTWKVLDEDNFERTTRARFYYKAPDKTRKEVLSPVDNKTVILTEITNGTIVTIIDAKGRPFTNDLKDYFKERVIPSPLDFLNNQSPSSRDFSIQSTTPKTTQSTRGIQSLSITPQVENKSFKRLDMTYDSNKGTILEKKITTPSGKVITTSFQDIQHINNQVWLPMKTVTSFYTKDNVEVQNIMEYEDVQINTGLPDSLFEAPK